MMNDKHKIPSEISSKQSSLVTAVLVIAILGLLATIIIRALKPTEANPATVEVEPTVINIQSVEAGTAPVISRVVLREVWREDELLVYEDIHFTDADGDAARVDFTLVETTAENVYLDDGFISERPYAQRDGTIHTATWTCHSGVHTVTLQVELIDQNDNRSAPYQFTITCRNRQ